MEILYTEGQEVKTVLFDATVQEIHAVTAQKTEHPVERGAPITDHVEPGAKRYSAEVVVSNTPIRSAGASGSVRGLDIKLSKRALTKGANRSANAQYETSEETRSASVLQFDEPFDRVQDTLDLLYKLMDNSTELTITTSIKAYDSMFLLDISAPRDVGHANSINFSLEFSQVRFAVTSTVAAPEPVQTRGKENKAKGAQATKEVKAAHTSLAGKLVEKQLGIGLRPGRNVGN